MLRRPREAGRSQRSSDLEGYGANPMRPEVRQLVLSTVEDAAIGGSCFFQVSDSDSRAIEMELPTR